MGNIKVNTLNSNTINNVQNTDFAFKICAQFGDCKTILYDISVDDANGIYIIMSMYNLIIFDTSGKLWQFKRDEVPPNNGNVRKAGSESFKYK